MPGRSRGLCYDAGMDTSIQPGLLHTFRYFTGVALGYFTVLAVFGAVLSDKSGTTGQMQIYINLLNHLGIFIYLSWGWLRRKLKRWYLPISLLAATVVPIFSNLFYLAEPLAKDSSLVIVRSWLLFPILIVPLVLIAWQYTFRHVLLFTLVTAIVELGVLYPVVGTVNADTLPILGLPLIRAFAFGTIGHIVTRLIATQQMQSKALLKANFRLSRHAETLEQLTLSRERNRLARELHDTLAHTLSGQAVNLEALKLMIPAGQTEILGMLDQALENTRSGLRETRRALKDLRSQPLEDMGLALAIRNLARDAASRAGFALSFDMADNLPQLPPDLEQAVYRIAQESLENIVRHAGASQVRVSLQEQGRCLEMVIHDDGIGVALERLDFEERLGLRGVKERSAEIGGNLVVSSQPGQGMSIRFSVEVPYDQGIDL